ncbi:hypothetical protein [Cellulomonas sp. URHD0024]|uniref:hypothetical protein n=1 Tax=Cellulomonas sp. URHD0024 TaxID=1302620 RepID=UPI0012DBD3BB|nr:hypothetical protein [Cellulomonas sp. URHD0024]
MPTNRRTSERPTPALVSGGTAMLLTVVLLVSQGGAAHGLDVPAPSPGPSVDRSLVEP